MQWPHFMKMASPIYYDAQRRMNILNKTLLMTALIAVGLTAGTAQRWFGLTLEMSFLASVWTKFMQCLVILAMRQF